MLNARRILVVSSSCSGRKLQAAASISSWSIGRTPVTQTVPASTTCSTLLLNVCSNHDGEARRYFSSAVERNSLFGYSPMSPSIPSQSSPVSSSNDNLYTTIPTEKDVTTSGGVWAPTSAKRDALAELKVAAAAVTAKGETVPTLDDLATREEKLDLYLADGIQLIGKVTDNNNTIVHQKLQEQLQDWWTKELHGTLVNQQSISVSDSVVVEEQKDHSLTQLQWEQVLNAFIRHTDELLATLPADRYLRDIRDYMDVEQTKVIKPPPPAVAGAAATTAAAPAVEPEPEDLVWKDTLVKLQQEAITNAAPPSTTPHNFEMAVLRFRLLLVKAAAEHLKESWKTLTTVSDQDVDRAAVKGESLDRQASTLSGDKLQAVLRTYLLGTCSERVDAWWDLMDRDQDGLLDQPNMNEVCEMTIRPVGAALNTLFQEALKASPVRTAPFLLGDESLASLAPPQKSGWRQRRKEEKAKKRLARMFQKTIQNHFRDEVELQHRLRCIYAWSNKQHQDNKIDSVLVEDTSGWSGSSSGRKRYVELPPKISLPEFREVQREHLKHLDRVAEEYLKSFREDLLVLQGKGRQRSELIKDSALFLTIVSVVDFIITTL